MYQLNFLKLFQNSLDIASVPLETPLNIVFLSFSKKKHVLYGEYVPYGENLFRFCECQTWSFESFKSQIKTI